MLSELSRHTFVCLMLLSSPRVFCFSTFCSWTPCTCIPAVWEVRQLSKPQSVCSDYSFCGNSILLPHLCLAEPTWRAKLGNTSPWRPYLPLSLEQSSPVSLLWPTLPHPPTSYRTSHLSKSSPGNRKEMLSDAFGIKSREHLAEVLPKRLTLLNPSEL